MPQDHDEEIPFLTKDESEQWRNRPRACKTPSYRVLAALHICLIALYTAAAVLWTRSRPNVCAISENNLRGGSYALVGP